MAPNQTETQDEGKNVYVEVDVKRLPAFSSLQAEVRAVVRASSWFERFGIDWCYFLAALAMVPLALRLLSEGGWGNYVTAGVLFAVYHSIVANKTGHLSVHGSMAESEWINTLVSYFSTEFVGCFSAFQGDVTHIRFHHPHTNIIGLGDSSTWKIPQLSRLPYLFVAPTFLPIITPLVAIAELARCRHWLRLVAFLGVMTSGVAFHVFLLLKYGGMTSVWSALAFMFVYRAVFAYSFIHVNIFQHIGLPMWSPTSRPSRVYQMSHGVLNLSRNSVLDHVFGHSLINCHVEHHLFTKLSDQMCLKVKPRVRRFLEKSGLQYNEDSYMSRLRIFWKHYDELMVDAPPITHFVGIQ